MLGVRKFFAVGVLLCLLVERSKGTSTEHFKKIARALIQECRDEVSFTNDDMESVINVGPHFSPAAQCLVECNMRKIGMMRDGRLVPPEEFVVPYKNLFADEPKRLKDPLGVVTACYEQEMKNPHTNPCDVAFANVVCASTVVYGAAPQPKTNQSEN